jgi:hypothetical protein
MQNIRVVHLGGSKVPRFQIEGAEPVEISPPPRPGQNPAREKWWASNAYSLLFGSGPGQALLAEARKTKEPICIEVASADPEILRWPWLSLEDSAGLHPFQQLHHVSLSDRLPTFRGARLIGASNQPSAVESDSDSFHWNTRINDTTATLGRVLVLGGEYEVETAIQPQLGTGALSTHPISRAKLPPETRVAFEFRIRGGLLRAAGQSAEWVRSPDLLVGLNGTETFRAVLVPQEGTVTLQLRLLARGVLVAGQELIFKVVGRADEQTQLLSAPTPPHVATEAMTPEPAAWRLDFERRGEQFYLRAESGALAGRNWIPAERSAKEIADEAIRMRRLLTDLSETYTQDPVNEFGIVASDDVLLRFAQAGAAMHAAIFGDPRDANVPRDLSDLAVALAKTRGGRLQIVAEHLPFPWGVLYDGLAAGKGPLTRAADVDIGRFWGGRFRIDRCVIGRIRHAPSPVLGNGGLRVKSCLNPNISAANSTICRTSRP